MSDPQNFGLDQLGQRLQAMGQPDAAPAPEPRLRPYQGAPLPVGQPTITPSSNGQTVAPPTAIPRTIPPYEAFEDLHTTPTPENTFHTNGAANSVWPSHPLSEPTPEEAIPAAPKALPTPAEDPNAPKSGLQRAIEAVRSALPVVQKILPLLDGNFANVLATLAGQPSHPPPVKVDLDPLERGLADLRTGQRDLRGQMQEQVVSLKRVEDQLERVREATDRNTLEQQELVEDLRSVGNRINTFAVIGIIVLAISLGLNIYFLVQLQHILR